MLRDTSRRPGEVATLAFFERLLEVKVVGVGTLVRNLNLEG